MDIFEKIETMFDNEDISREILNELKEIKNLLKLGKHQYSVQYKQSLPKEYYDFVRNFRNEMSENPRKGHFPEFEVDGMLLAIDSRRLIYNKKTRRYLPKYKAYEIYEKLYEANIAKKVDVVF